MTVDDSDQTLVRRALGGDTAAYDSLVRRHRRAALARALAIVLDSFAAEDVAQDAFVQAYEQLAMLRDHSRFETWLLTIVHRRALNALRADRRRRAVALTDAIPDRASDTTGVDGGLRASRASLLAALASLSAAQRTVVLLADLEGWSHARISRIVGCSLVMSRRHLFDARKRLRDLLARETDQ